MVYILYNPKSNQGKGRTFINQAVKKYSSEKVETKNISDIISYKDFFISLNKEDKIVLLGGDGTINYLVNELQGIELENEIFVFKAGTGNDFLRDIFDSEPEDGTVVKLNDYIENLPIITVKGKDYYFINGVGYGLDGKCVTIANKQIAQGKTDINYAGIAIKLMLVSYKPTNATVIVDGKEYKYRKVWISPIMNGRYYGGGMKVTPNQDRKSDVISTCLFYGTGKLRTLMIFPNIFKGEHIKYTKNIALHSGHKITIKLDKPQDIQIDGELIRNVTEITARK